MSAATVPSLCDHMLGRAYTRPKHATELLPASIERIYCAHHDRDEVGLRISDDVLKAFLRARRTSAWRQKVREVAVLVVFGEILAIGALALAGAALAAVR